MSATSTLRLPTPRAHGSHREREIVEGERDVRDLDAEIADIARALFARRARGRRSRA
jgi:hypothetical protein